MSVKLVKAEVQDIEELYSIVEERIRYYSSIQYNMKPKPARFPSLEDFQRHQDKGDLYIIETPEDKKAGVAAVSEENEQWLMNMDDYSVLYYQFSIIRLNVTVMLKDVLSEIEKIAVSRNKKTVRLFHEADEKFAETTYGKIGYYALGTFVKDGETIVIREKRLSV